MRSVPSTAASTRSSRSSGSSASTAAVVPAVSGRRGARRSQPALTVESAKVPMARARSTMAAFSIVSSGRWMGSVVTALVTARFWTVWLDF